MAQNSFYTYTEKHHYEVEKNVAYGKVNDYLVTLYQGRNYKTFFIPLPSITNLEKKQVIEFIRENRKTYKILRIFFDNTVLTIKINEMYFPLDVSLIEELMTKVTSFLKENQICLGQHCIFCGKENATKKVKLTRIEYYMHQTCYDKALVEVDKEMKKSAEEINYSYFGSILGVFIIAVLWVVLSQATWLSAVLTFLFGWFAFSFYLMFHGRVTKKTSVFIYIVTYLAYLLSAFAILFINNLGIMDLFASENRNVLYNIAFGIIMTTLGLTFLAYRLRKM